MARLQAVLMQLLGDQVPRRDLCLLLLGIAWQLDHCHAVEQRPGDVVLYVGRGDEQHLRQIEGYLDEMVAEAVVLLSIKHFQQRRAGIAPEVGVHLVDLVK